MYLPYLRRKAAAIIPDQPKKFSFLMMGILCELRHKHNAPHKYDCGQCYYKKAATGSAGLIA